VKRLLIVLLVIGSFGCTKQPPDLTPEAKTAFYATRVIKVLDVVRDAAIAANELVPPVISTNDTRKVVLWHKTTIQVISAAPDGWKPTVKTNIYLLTCNPEAYVPGPGIPNLQECQPQIPADANDRLRPYINLALVVISEVL
jgi:hypothetical protein